MKRGTCCNRAQTDVLARASLVLEASGVSEQCRAVAASIACAPCHPLYGTGALSGVCSSMCDSWLAACSEDFFAHGDAGGALSPCLDHSLVCARMRDMFSSGAALCAKMGYSAAEDNCYDGSVPAALVGAYEPEVFEEKAEPASPLLYSLVGHLRFHFLFLVLPRSCTCCRPPQVSAPVYFATVAAAVLSAVAAVVLSRRRVRWAGSGADFAEEPHLSAALAREARAAAAEARLASAPAPEGERAVERRVH